MIVAQEEPAKVERRQIEIAFSHIPTRLGIPMVVKCAYPFVKRTPANKYGP